MGSRQRAVDTPAFDGDGLIRRCAGNRALAAELVGLFHANVERMLEAVTSASRGNDAKALERSAHALKGMLANFGAEKAVALAWELENKGRTGATQGRQALLEELGEAVATLRRELRAAFPEA